MNIRILVVDDELSIREFFEILLRKEGYEAVLAESGELALQSLEKESFDLVISDIAMPDVNGIEVLRRARRLNPEAMVIMITAYASAETAIEAMKEGAYDYLPKPFKVDEIRLTIQKALEASRLRRENEALRRELQEKYGFSQLLGRSPAMRRICELIVKVSDSRASVILSGESGTGKELVARAIHYNGPRGKKPFVSLNCGAIPENLMESELFGHVRGAFTGAVDNKKGLFEMAEGGTFFLDEVGELPPALQVKLLRVLQEKSFRRVGGVTDIQVDARVIAASNRDLEKEVALGRFRQDLFFRLNVVRLHLPPLRERREDIPILAAHFLQKYAAESGRAIVAFSPEAMRCLEAYFYPGNVRELENAVESAVAVEGGTQISLASLPLKLQQAAGATAGPALEAADFPDEGVELEKMIDRLEQAYLKKALALSGGKKQEAAKRLGLTFRSLRYRLRKHHLD